jgi:hypothetical protein
MSVARPLSALVVLLVALAPAAQAYAQPVFYFLKDAPGPQDEIPDVPSPIPLPVALPTLAVDPGVMDPYDPKAPNAPNGTTGTERLVPVGTDLIVPVQFVTPADHAHPDRLKGPIFIGLWTGKSSTYQANLTVTLYEVPASGEPVALANASASLDFNESSVPEPTTFIPPDTSDPQAILFYEVAQVLPLVLRPPMLFILGPVDVPFGEDSSFALGFRLTQGSSPVPLPAGAFGSIRLRRRARPPPPPARPAAPAAARARWEAARSQATTRTRRASPCPSACWRCWPWPPWRPAAARSSHDATQWSHRANADRPSEERWKPGRRQSFRVSRVSRFVPAAVGDARRH